MKASSTCHLRRYQSRTVSGANPDSGKVVKTIAYCTNASDGGFGVLPALAAFRRSFSRAIPIAASEFLIAQTRPSTEAADPFPVLVHAPPKSRRRHNGMIRN